MKIKILKGTNQIGGSIVEIESNEGNKILIDYGKDLIESNSNKLVIDWSQYKGVFITHYHDDHIGLIHEIPKSVNVFIEKVTYEIYCLLLKINGKEALNENIIPFDENQTTYFSDFKITNYIVDHSAFNSLMFLIECDGKRILHTGDFRDNGYKGKAIEQIIKKIKHVDVLLMEGTTINRSCKDNITEQMLSSEIEEKTRKYKQVLVLQSSTNIDRLVTIYKVASNTNKILVLDAITAIMSDIISRHNKKIPNYITFKNVYTFTPFNRSEFNKEEKSDFYNKHIAPLKKDAHHLMCYKDFILTIKTSMLRDIKMYYKKGYLNNCCLIYSMWDGYKENMNYFFDEIKEMNIDVIDAHTSGHADEQARRKVLNNLSYNYLIPLHTDNKEKFKKYSNTYILDDSEIFEVI